MKNRYIFTAKRIRSLLVVFWGGIIVALLAQEAFSSFEPNNLVSHFKNTKVTKSEEPIDPFEKLKLTARAAYVFDIKSGQVLFSKNENEKLPLASVTKLMTALIAREHASESAVITITKDDLAVEGDSGLFVGERWRLQDLLNVTLIMSSNDGAHAIATFVGADGRLENFPDLNVTRERFVQMMNDKALELGLEQMQFFNESGLDINENQSGGYGSAQNVAKLLARLWAEYPNSVEGTAHKDTSIYSQDNIEHYLPNTNEIVGHIPGLIASKTGFTDIAGGNLAIIFDKGIGEPVALVVLGSGYKERFDDMQKLIDATMKKEIKLAGAQ